MIKTVGLNHQHQGRATGRAVENEIDALLMEFKSGYLQNIAARFNKNYDGKKHGQYCSKIKTATNTRKKPLTDNEKLKFMAFMRHLSEVVYSFHGLSLSTCIHSLVASQLLYPLRYHPMAKNRFGWRRGFSQRGAKDTNRNAY